MLGCDHVTLYESTISSTAVQCGTCAACASLTAAWQHLPSLAHTEWLRAVYVYIISVVCQCLCVSICIRLVWRLHVCSSLVCVCRAPG